MGEQKKRILILGAGVMQGPAIDCARAMGLETAVIDGDPYAPMAAMADRFEPIDLKDLHKIEAFARTLQAGGGLDGVMTAGTDFSASVAWTAEKLGLPGISYETALNASDKERMRNRFTEAGLPSPAFQVYTAVPAALPFSYPAVVKPVDNMGARGCRRVDNGAELREAVEKALGFSRSGRVIVEEYMEGPEFSVDAVVYRGTVTICGLADRHIVFPPYFIEMGHTMPTNIPLKDQEALIGVFIQGIRALGIDNGAAKGDIKLTRRGPMIGEIAARLSGGYMSGWTYPYASGANPAGGAICAALGREPEGLTPTRNWTSAERAFISIPGIVRSIEGLEEARAVPGVKDIFLRAEPGKRISFPENNVSKAGNVISAAPDRTGAIGAAETAARKILIRLAAPDPETDAFLAGSLSPESAESGPLFPPPAYTVSNSFIEELPTMTPGADYAGRSIGETLEAVEKLTGLDLTAETLQPVLGREFRAALIRGGYQAAVYYIDRWYINAGKSPPGIPIHR
jgi:biotin carboxylase